MRVGFSGTRLGMTTPQTRRLYTIINALRPSEVHHGDCQGADAGFAELVSGNWPRCRIVVHPPSDDAFRAFTRWGTALPPKHYFDRNRDIVDVCDVLIAAPADMAVRSRGGTWWTVRYANERGTAVWIIWPNGVSSPGHVTAAPRRQSTAGSRRGG